MQSLCPCQAKRQNRRAFRFTNGISAFFLLGLVVASLLNTAWADQPTVNKAENATVTVGDWLVVGSNRPSIQTVQIRGNLSSAKYSAFPMYPASEFAFTSSAPNSFLLLLQIDYNSEYMVELAVLHSRNSTRDSLVSYYLSSGKLALTLNVTFRAPPSPATADLRASTSPWSSFLGWLSRFSEAFPLWVKVLYLILGLQFLVVGHQWLQFENKKRRLGPTAQAFDRGNITYLWSEILYKFLLTSFLAIALIMGGQLLLLFVLRFMFLAQIDILNLWDLFVLGFAAGITVIAYLARLILEKSFELRPLQEDW